MKNAIFKNPEIEFVVRALFLSREDANSRAGLQDV